ncbi:RsbRD N-terminal domain-containing protein [Desulfosediminicola ganghwensis]|uniref:RsbRD N-terminal domain-containing protein n=1 Tax=Desulfosediminicola ganghwensis TaxID=2569540 RepID=UPI0010AB5D82|nr:RsbRD N-terminal domain-containing protein [Desulfosediminicola ganghwensis]
MDLAEVIRNNRDKIVAQWVDYTLSTYPSSDFFKKEKDKFSNPTGVSIRDGLEQLFDMLAAGNDPEDFRGPVEQIVRIRAVQNFSPAEAVAPLNAVKHITRNMLEREKECSSLFKDLYDFEFAVDLAVLAAFDIYMEYREKLYSIRVREIKSGSSILTDSKCPSKLSLENTQDFIKKV